MCGTKSMRSNISPLVSPQDRTFILLYLVCMIYWSEPSDKLSAHIQSHNLSLIHSCFSPFIRPPTSISPHLYIQGSMASHRPWLHFAPHWQPWQGRPQPIKHNEHESLFYENNNTLAWPWPPLPACQSSQRAPSIHQSMRPEGLLYCIA